MGVDLSRTLSQGRRSQKGVVDLEQPSASDHFNLTAIQMINVLSCSPKVYASSSKFFFFVSRKPILPVINLSLVLLFLPLGENKIK